MTEYCPLTKKELEHNPTHLDKFKKFALDSFEKELDEFGIDLKEKGLSAADFKLKMNAVKNLRPDRTDDMAKFNELRNVFAELSNRYAQQKLSSSLRSSLGNRVTFKNEISSKKLEAYDHDDDDDEDENESQYYNDSVSQSKQKSRSNHQQHHHHHNEQSEETDDDVSLSNALESDEDDTEPTKSILNETTQSNRTTSRSRSPRKTPKVSGSLNAEDVSDLESISQLLTDRSANRKKNSNQNKKPINSKSNVSELKKKLEKQLDNSAKRGYKPPANAVPIGFQAKKRVEKDDNEEEDADSFASVSDLENELKNQRPRSGVRSSLQDSNSSSVWVSESHSIDLNIQNNQQNNNERPATGNSSKTLNFDSDDIENVE